MDTMDCTKDLAKVHSPEQNRAYQRVSMYHQLLIASQYLSSRFPPIYRPRLPPLVLSHPKGISTKDHFPTAMKKKKIFNTTANLLPNIKITNDICFFFIFAYLLSFFFFYLAQHGITFSIVQHWSVTIHTNVLTDILRVILNDFQFTRYLRATQLLTTSFNVFVNDRNNTWGRIVNKDFKYDIFQILSSHMRFFFFF